MDRRGFLRAGAAGAATVGLGPAFWRAAYAAPAQPGPGPYGPLATEPDANGMLLPAGFTSRVVAIAGTPVGDTGYPWHPFPDGGGVVPAAEGGWWYCGNSEVFTPLSGGCSAIGFAADGTIVAAHRLLAGTTANCSGGATPWGTWMSCEESPRGLVYECDPATPLSGEARPALGVFSHEAVAVDPDGQVLYLTEDDLIDDEIDDNAGEGGAISGGFYRFTPDAYPDLSSGRLEAATLTSPDGGAVTWVEIDPSKPLSTTQPDAQPRPDGTSQFAGAEGCWYDARHVYFTTKVNGRVWDFDVAAGTITVLYDAAAFEEPVLSGVDNLVVAGPGDLYVAEDGGNMEVVVISAERQVAPLLRLPDHPADFTEVAGISFNPSGDRFYLSSRSWGPGGPGVGTTYEVTGPFRGAAARPAAPATTSTIPARPAPASRGTLPATGGSIPGAGAVAAAAAGVLWLRTRLRERR